MTQKLINRVLLTNDDGIDAPGMALLSRLAEQFANEVWIVAPAIDQSGVSNAVSLKTPLRVAKRSERQFAVYGTPADCSAFALRQAMRDTPPDLVISGINNGSNVGFETSLSGTVGGAMTAAVMGIKAIALSQATDEQGNTPTDWSCAEAFTLPIIQQILSHDLPKQSCININFPACPASAVKGSKITMQGAAAPEGLVMTPVTDPQNTHYYWFRANRPEHARQIEHELDAVNMNYIAITPLHYDRTDHQTRQALQTKFSV